MTPVAFGYSLSLSLLVDISFLLCFLKQTTRSEKFSELADAHRQNSSRRCDSGDYHCCAFDACWAHNPSSEHLIRPHLSGDAVILE